MSQRALRTDDVERALVMAEKAEADSAVWPGWAKQIHDMLREYGVGPGDAREIDLPQEVANWLSDFDPKTQKDVAALTAENGKLREALRQAAEWFQQYADGHTAKGDTDKAARNQSRADACTAALNPEKPE